MSEIRTYSDFGRLKSVRFPNSSDFKQCLKSKENVWFLDENLCPNSELMVQTQRFTFGYIIENVQFSTYK